MGTVSDLLSGLTPKQRERLLAAQTPAVRAQLAAATGERQAKGPTWRRPVHATATASERTVVVTLKGLVLVSEANTREPWAVRHARRTFQRRHVGAALASLGPCPLALPLAVTITRSGPRALDTDNLQGSAKAVRDELALWLGVDDGPSAPVSWHVAQVRGPYGCRLELTGAA